MQGVGMSSSRTNRGMSDLGGEAPTNPLGELHLAGSFDRGEGLGCRV